MEDRAAQMACKHARQWQFAASPSHDDQVQLGVWDRQVRWAVNNLDDEESKIYVALSSPSHSVQLEFANRFVCAVKSRVFAGETWWQVGQDWRLQRLEMDQNPGDFFSCFESTYSLLEYPPSASDTLHVLLSVLSKQLTSAVVRDPEVLPILQKLRSHRQTECCSVWPAIKSVFLSHHACLREASCQKAAPCFAHVASVSAEDGSAAEASAASVPMQGKQLPTRIHQ